MKKLIVLVLIAAVAALSFADDALVLPKGVLRTYITGAYASFSQEFDDTAEKVDLTGSDSLSALNLGGAVEYGVTDWISAAVQWAPGWTVWSATQNGTVVFPGMDYENLLLNGPFNIFAGAKAQIVGPKAPVVNEKLRLAAALGVKIPVNAPDSDYWADQLTAATGGEDWNGAYNDRPLLGIGARAYFDYVASQNLYFNLYSEMIFYPGTVKRNELSLGDYAAVAFGDPNSDVSLGYDLTLEAEPHYEMMLGEGIRLGIGLPVTFSMSPELKYDDTAQADTDSYLLTVGPNVSLFMLKSFIPFEVELGYTLPLVGKNAFASNSLVLQLKSYLKF